MLKRQSYNEVQQALIANGKWRGYVCYASIAEFHVNQGWHIGVYVEMSTTVTMTDFYGKKTTEEYQKKTEEMHKLHGVADGLKYSPYTADLRKEYGPKIVYWELTGED